MKIYLNKYRRHWLSPYTILEKVLFWVDQDQIYDLHKTKKQPKWIKKLINILEIPCGWLMKFLDVVHPKIDYVKIDPWDTWSLDHSLAQIILPALKQLRATKHGVPGEFVHTKDGSKEIPFARAERKWNAVLDHMIWSFEQIVLEDREEQFHLTGEFDVHAYTAYYKRVDDGLQLFGKYYRNLWD